MSAGRCSVCRHPERRALEQAHVGGATLRELAKQYGKDKSTIHNHISKHMPRAVREAAEVIEERSHGDGILSELLTLRDEARRLQARAEAKGDVRTAIAALRELTRLVELKARVMGEIRDREINITNVQIDPATAEKMAAVFLARRRAALPTGQQPVGDVEVIENECSIWRCP